MDHVVFVMVYVSFLLECFRLQEQGLSAEAITPAVWRAVEIRIVYLWKLIIWENILSYLLYQTIERPELCLILL